MKATKAPAKLQPQMGTIELSIVRQVVHPLMADPHGASIGEMVDRLLCETTDSEEGIVQSVTVRLFPDQLNGIAAFYHNTIYHDTNNN